MGGHMRSYFAKLSIPPKSETMDEVLDNSAELTHFPIQSASSHTSHPQKKLAHNYRSLNPGLTLKTQPAQDPNATANILQQPR